MQGSRLILSVMLVLGVTLTASDALAAKRKKIFINGVNLSGVYLVNQTFKYCTVRIDSKGNVHITAPGVSLKTAGRVKTPTPRPRRYIGVATDYYIVSYTNRPGATQYDMEVFINGKFVRRIRSSAKQVVMKVSHLLKRGKNEVLFVARKNYGGKARISDSPVDFVRVILGRGFMSRGRLVIKTSEAEMKRSAAEIKPVIYGKYIVKIR